MAPDAQGHPTSEKPGLKLPVLVYGLVEVRRLKREVEGLDDFIRQAAIREPGKQAALPRVTRLLDALSADNGRNLLQEADREEIHKFLIDTEQTAPTIHISFASDPSATFVSKLVTWLRANIHPTVMLQIGLQPSIAAGCVVRTPNKSFDLSLRHNLTDQRAKLIEALNALDMPKTAPVASVAPSPEVSQL